MPLINDNDNIYDTDATHPIYLTQNKRIYCLCAQYGYAECGLYFEKVAYDQLENGYDGGEEGTKKSLVYNDGIKDQPPKKK